MLNAVLWFCIGLLCLVKGGDWFVDGAVGIARRFRLPDLLIGATVVSVGTTLPEVMISASSALGGHGEIAYGNAIGSIICNAALVAAVTIAVRPGKADAAALRLPAGFFFAAAAFYAAVAYTTGFFSRWAGAVLLGLFAAYMAAQILSARRTPAPAPEAEQPAEAPAGPLALELVRLALSAALIALGADLMVDNGVLIAAGLGVPESVIALTVAEPDVALLMAALAGGCIGFLPYNLNPAKIFMGDTGSTFLGFILATVSIEGLFKSYAIISFAVPFLMLGLPIFDTCFAILRRVSHGQSPMSPDRGHIHHRLIDMGFNQKQAVAVLYVISAILGLSAVVLTTTNVVRAMVVLLALCVAGGMAAKLYLDRMNHRDQDGARPPQGRGGAKPRKLHNPPSDVAGSDYFFGEEERSDK